MLIFKPEPKVCVDLLSLTAIFYLRSYTMQIVKLTVTLIAASVSAAVLADGSAPVYGAAVPAATATPASPEAWVAKMTDPTQNASAFKDPQKFIPWLVAVTDPSTAMAMGNAMMNPNTSLKMMTGFMSPAAFQNYMQFMDPAVSMKWMGAAMDPNFYTAAMTTMANPSTMMKIMMMPMDPRMMNMGMQMMNPSLYTNWMMAPMSPQAMNAMMAPMNPGMYTNWMGAAMNPATYGPMGSMMNPATYGSMGNMMNPMMMMAPPAAAPAADPAK
jgi:hypothetical protein